MLNTDRLCPGCMADNGGERVCPVCGCDSESANPENCLTVGTRLADRYTVGLAKSANGEGITYIGWDIGQDAVVSIREYYPVGFALRNPDKTVGMVSGGEYIFNEGLMEFIEINRTVKEAELPSLISVAEVFEENGTAYAVSRSVASITMNEFLKKNGGTLKWEQARPLFLPLIDTIKGMNDRRIFHGGISCDTVLVGRDGKLRISGYSVKRLRMAEGGMKPELFPGFAAAEQYGGDTCRNDARTDVYGLCAVLFRVLIGTLPPEAPERLKYDAMTIPARFAEELPRHVLSALANGLQVLPQNRTANIEAFKNELVYAETAEQNKKSSATPESVKKAAPKTEPKGSTVKYVIISAACTAVVFMAIVAVLVFTVFKEDFFGSTSQDDGGSVSVAAPSVDQIGAVDSGAGESTVLFEVPSLLGKYFSELEDDEACEKFNITIKNLEYSDKYARGQICAQTVAESSEVARDTKIEVTVSLGAREIKIANVLGLDEVNAKLELLKQGFLYNNIEVLEKYDESKKPGAVIEQEPKYGTQISPEAKVKIFVNAYTGDEEDNSSPYSRSN